MADSSVRDAVQDATRNFRLLSNELEEFTAEMVKPGKPELFFLAALCTI